MQRLSNWLENNLRRSTRSVSRSRRQKRDLNNKTHRSTKIVAFGNNLRRNFSEEEKSKIENSYFREGFFIFLIPINRD